MMHAVTAPSFAQVGSLPLYSLGSSGDSGLPGYWGGYLSNGSLGTSPTLDAVWQNAGGVHLFLAETPSDFTTFNSTLADALPRIAPGGGLRVLWIVNPNDAAGAWRTRALFAASKGSGSTITWSVSRQALFVLGAYAVAIDSGAALTQASSAAGYGIAVDAGSLHFLAPGGGWPAQSASAMLPFSGTAVGAWSGMLSVANANGVDGMAQLGVALRYSVPANDERSGGEVITIAMPVIAQTASAITLALSFDPLNPLEPKRTNLAFASGTTALHAFFITARGHRTTLTPITNAAAPLWSARLAFCRTPIFLISDSDSYYDYYLAPDGAFSTAVLPTDAFVSAPDPTLDRIALGMSGLEYAGVPASEHAIAFFIAGNSAFAPNAVDSAFIDPLAPRLTSLATTSYVTFLPATAGTAGIPYYAQPPQAPLFTFGTSLGTGFMDYLELAAATLPSYAAGGDVPAVLPVGIYSGIDPALQQAARLLESAALAPARRAAAGAPPLALDAVDLPALAVTPQGLILTLNSTSTAVDGLVVGNMVDAAEPLLAFTSAAPPFQQAILSNEVFFVVSNAATFMNAASVRYRLDPFTLLLLPAAGVPASVVSALDNLLKPDYSIFDDERAFIAAIDSVAHDYVANILPVAGLLKPNLEGWTFQLSPRSWRRSAKNPTIMLFKYCGRSLQAMVDDTGTWHWPEAAEDGAGKLAPTQQTIQDIFKAARDAPPDSTYRRFYDEVVANANWNGVLFLNAPVAIAELPLELQFVTAGIDPARFYAHHVGFSVTPFNVTSTAITLQQTAVFGLIDYSDPTDLVLAKGIQFAFKTLSLIARFANARLTEFSAKVELMMNVLFGARLTKQNTTRGNNLVLDGSYQRRPGGAPSYSFALRDQNVYAVANSALASIEILGVQLQTARGTDSGLTITTDFLLSGNLRFIELPIFDLFSYGVEQIVPDGTRSADGFLRYRNLLVQMRFPLAAPSSQTFQVFEGRRISFDNANSLPRPRSLVKNFPLQLTGCVAAIAAAGEAGDAGQRPEDLGYVSISAPISQVPLSPPWYGLVFDVDLGTLGALAGSAGLSITLLAAWMPGIEDAEPPLYLGIRVPSGDPLSAVLPVQGVMRIGFRSFQFQAHDEDDPLAPVRSYMLRMRRLALSILGWSFPPGNADIFLFGNPDGGGRASLGWYGAYVPDKKEKKSENAATNIVRGRPSLQTARRLAAGRRGLPPGGGS